MNKDQLISAVYELGQRHRIPLNHLVVGFGGAMVMLGLREQTNDIDIDVPPELYAFLKEQGYAERPILNALGGFTMSVDKHIDVRVDPYLDREDTWEVGDGAIWHHTAKIVLENKLILNREKDQEDIRKLKAYIGI